MLTKSTGRVGNATIFGTKRPATGLASVSPDGISVLGRADPHVFAPHASCSSTTSRGMRYSLPTLKCASVPARQRLRTVGAEHPLRVRRIERQFCQESYRDGYPLAICSSWIRSARRVIASSCNRSGCGSYHRRACSFSAGQPLRPRRRLLIVSINARQSSVALGGEGASGSAPIGSAAPIMWSRIPSADAGPRPGMSCITRNPAMPSRGFSTKRSNARMSLICAVSRNFRPP